MCYSQFRPFGSGRLTADTFLRGRKAARNRPSRAPSTDRSGFCPRDQTLSIILSSWERTVILSQAWDMATTRRQLAYGMLASLFSKDPLKAASEVLEKTTTPGWFSSPDINAAVLDV